MQHCPNCGAGELKIIAAILERPVIEEIFTHLGLDPQPPGAGCVRRVSEVIGGLPQIAPKKHCVPRLWQGGMRCRGRPV
jgi:hypothetical protein